MLAARYPRSVEASARRRQRAPKSADAVVIGGGIVGCAAAAIMADRGAHVVLVEASAIGAGASGRNLGAIQHPFDAVLAGLYRDSLDRYRALAADDASDFSIGSAPAGLLLLNRDADAAGAQARRMADAFPELHPELLSEHDVHRLEPALAPGPAGVRLATGFPIPPAAATGAWAALAEERGAFIILGSPARPAVRSGRVTGVAMEDGTTISSAAVLVAAGPWSPPLADPSGAWRPIHATYGVTLQLRLGEHAPRHVVEEDEVDALNRAAAATARARQETDPDADPPSLFSIASAAGVSTLGSTFLAHEPDPARIGSILLRRAAEYLPAVLEAEVIGRRMCARPQSVDGRPFIGAVAGTDGLFVCAGHGPWGISTGPASAAMAARAILDGTLPPPELAAARPV